MTSRPRRAVDPPILLVEDKDSLRTMLRLALEAQGHVVIEARDQTEAVAALQATRPGVVLSDLRLPVGDGFGVLRAAGSSSTISTRSAIALVSAVSELVSAASVIFTLWAG